MHFKKEHFLKIHFQEYTFEKCTCEKCTFEKDTFKKFTYKKYTFQKYILENTPCRLHFGKYSSIDSNVFHTLKSPDTEEKKCFTGIFYKD